MFFQKNIKNVQVIFNAMHREVRHYISIHLKRIAILCQDKTQLAPLKKKISMEDPQKLCSAEGQDPSVSATSNSMQIRTATSDATPSYCPRRHPPPALKPVPLLSSSSPRKFAPRKSIRKRPKNPNRSDRIIHPRVAVRGHVSGDRRRPGSLPLLIPLDRHFSASI